MHRNGPLQQVGLLSSPYLTLTGVMSYYMTILIIFGHRQPRAFLFHCGSPLSFLVICYGYIPDARRPYLPYYHTYSRMISY